MVQSMYSGRVLWYENELRKRKWARFEKIDYRRRRKFIKNQLRRGDAALYFLKNVLIVVVVI